MLPRLFSLFFVLCLSVFSPPAISEERVLSPEDQAILDMAKKEMPLPIVKVTASPVNEEKRQVVIEMSTEDTASAKQPIRVHIAFQVRRGNDGDLEQALRQASVAAKEFIKAAKSQSALTEIHWVD